MTSNEDLSDDALGRSMDEFHNSWESYLDIKLLDFNSRLTSIINICGFPVSNVSVETSEENIDTVTRIYGRYSVYIYDGKLGMHLSTHVKLPGKN